VSSKPAHRPSSRVARFISYQSSPLPAAGKGDPPHVALGLADIDLPTSQTIALGTIVTELVLNAMKHGAKNGHKARMKVSLEKFKADVLHLAVEDDGDGLAVSIRRAAPDSGSSSSAMTAQLHGALRPVLAAERTRFEITFPCRGGSA
jgi:two-component sensor histidine kinase